MELPKSSSESSALGLKRKKREFGGNRTFKLARTNGGHEMRFYSSDHAYGYCALRHSAVATNHLNYVKSRTPQRIMFYSGGEWADFPEFVTSSLVKAFRDKMSAVHLSISGGCYLFDFPSMVLINLKNGGKRSVSWIDELDKCFFPAFFFDEDHFPIGSCNNQNSTVMVPASAPNTAGAREQSQASGALPKTPCGSSCQEVVVKTEVIEESTSVNRASLVSVKQALPIHMLCSELVKLERDSRNFTVVMRTFLSGSCNFADHTSIIGIYRFNPKISSALAQQDSFKKQVTLTKHRRGDANIRYGWFGTSSEGVYRILLHGFGRGNEVSEEAAYGTGVYLMPENHSFASVKCYDDDENGAQYVILCQVVLGNMEKVPAGSKQSSPSSPEFDNGVDDLLQPSCYVVWGSHITTHIHPEYIVSFKLSPTGRECLAGLKEAKGNSNFVSGNQENIPINYTASRPKSPWISFSLLFAEIKDKVSPLAMELLNLHHREFKNKMISRDELVKKLRLIVGDLVLISTLKRLQQNVRSFRFVNEYEDKFYFNHSLATSSHLCIQVSL